MTIEADAVVRGLNTVGIDAAVSKSDAGPVVLLNPGDASTFLELIVELRGGDINSAAGPAPRDVLSLLRRFAASCPHGGRDDEEDDERCRYCGRAGVEDAWPVAAEEHSIRCLWAMANQTARRYPQ